MPGAGWIGLDATSGLFAGEGHIPLSATPHPPPPPRSPAPPSQSRSASPSTNRSPASTRTPASPSPTPTSQWAAVDALGEVVDAHLCGGDVRLTMGGEPTFVSTGDTSSPQWSTAADGPDKRRLATALADPTPASVCRVRPRPSRSGQVVPG
jgi:hypothetical protein